MNRITVVISAVLTAALAFGTAVLPVSSATVQRPFRQKKVTAHLYSKDKTVSLTCLFYDDLPAVPYISMTDYLSNVFEGEFKLTEKGNGVYQLTTPAGKKVLTDTKKDTVHFDEFESFFSLKSKGKEGKPPEAPYILAPKLTYKTSPKSADFDFSKYHIDITAANKNVYFPLATISDLFDTSYRAAQYVDGKIYFTDVTEKNYFDNQALLKPVRDKFLIDYTYNELCFVMDNLYGRPPKAKNAGALKEKTFDEWLSAKNNISVKKLLHSDSLLDFVRGLGQLDALFGDGGHTSFCFGYFLALEEHPVSEFSKQLTKILQTPKTDEDNTLLTVAQQISSAAADAQLLSQIRGKCFEKLEKIKEWSRQKQDASANPAEDNKPAATLYVADETAVFSFDSFIDEVVEPFKWSLDYAKEKGLKNFLLDLSVNGGGSSSAALYMLSVITGQDYLPEYGVKTGNSIKETGQIDTDLNGAVDKKDAVRYDFHFAMLTSRLSFSCGNLMPVLAKDKGVVILGENSGGGTCMLSKPTLASGMPYAISGVLMMTHENGQDVDSGAEPHYPLMSSETDNIAEAQKLYDMEKIQADIADFYTNGAPANRLPAVMTREQSAVALLLIGAALLVGAAFVAVIVCIKRKHYQKS